MNDNQRTLLSGTRRQVIFQNREYERIADLADLASRAVIHPENLTSAEIKEVGWGFLMAMQLWFRSMPLASTPETKTPAA